MFIRNAWYVAAWADEISDLPLARRICNEPVVLYRDWQSRPAALLDMCCHRGAPLHLGKVVEEGLQCGYHGLIFDHSGACVQVPGQDRIVERTRVRGFPVVEQDGFIWIWMGDPAKADPAKAIDFLNTAALYGRANPAVLYVRGMAYEQAGRYAEAQQDIEKALSFKSRGPDLIYAVAQLELARVLQKEGDVPKARVAYQNFLADWKNADPDVPLLHEAKAEYAKLQ